MINYYCPGFFSGKKLYEEIFILRDKYPEIFEEDVNIKYIFGSFPNMKWNGGSVDRGKRIFLSEILDVKELYSYYNIPLQLTLTNSSLKEENLTDDYCNRILEIMDNGINEVLVSTELMENYIKKNYPNYKINRSIVNTEVDYDWEEVLESNRFNNIVIPRRYSKDFNFLKKINKKYRNRMEILCNDPCPVDCPFLYTHYKKFDEANLYDPSKVDYSCHNEKLKYLPFNFDLTALITLKDIREQYLKLGYTEFKLSGRTSYNSILISLYNYIIKPEYQNLFLKNFLS